MTASAVTPSHYLTWYLHKQNVVYQLIKETSPLLLRFFYNNHHMLILPVEEVCMQSEEQRAIAESNVFVCVFRAVRVCLQLHSGYVLRSLLKKSGSPAASCTQCTHVQIIIALILCNSRTKPLSMKNIG